MDLGKEIYMECSQGMSNIEKNDCIILNKSIYRLVPAMRPYCKKAVKIVKNLGIIGGSVNLCLYVKKSAKCVVYIVLYIDDNLMVRDMVAIDDVISALKNNQLALKVMEGLQDYLSCKIKFLEDKKRA